MKRYSKRNTHRISRNRNSLHKRKSHKKKISPQNEHIQNVLYELEQIKFPTCTSRKNISNKGIEAFVLGDVNYRGQALVNFKTRGPSRYNKKFKSLYNSLRKLISHHDPDFIYTTIQVNKNVFCEPHVDKNNVGPSYVIALGDFIGGNIVVEGKEINIHNKMFQFNGTKGHWITPFTGTRYSIVFFEHTFKPPHPSTRNLVVKHDGLYQNGTLIKSYK
jgi:hypothetical protein